MRIPVSDLTGTILIGSSEAETRDLLSGLIGGKLGKKATCVHETSDLLLEVLDKQVDLIIIDVDLAGLPIAKTIQIIRKCRPRVPVIALSGDYSVETGSSVMEQGVFYYMYKPIDMESLEEIIRSALKKLEREQSQERR
ncbi:MAG: response regulator [Nitrospirae bacterium]|nr:response regulator [Nitrospirota bacterium]